MPYFLFYVLRRLHYVYSIRRLQKLFFLFSFFHCILCAIISFLFLRMTYSSHICLHTYTTYNGRSASLVASSSPSTFSSLFFPRRRSFRSPFVISSSFIIIRRSSFAVRRCTRFRVLRGTTAGHTQEEQAQISRRTDIHWPGKARVR